MTLIVGVKCNDGIIIGSDGARSVSGIIQPAVKLHILRDDWIVGLAGDVGINQQNLASLNALYTNTTASRPRQSICSQIGKTIRDCYNSKLGIKPQALVSNTPPHPDLQVAALVALPSKEDIDLVHFDFRGNSTLASNSPPFFAIGSGSLIAYSTLALLKNACWADDIPPMPVGMFTIVYTLVHSISIGGEIRSF